ncbi:MAG: fused MFS/spermidine synthase [Alphaproteobacteria bacterium]|nr:fused MFS/spermidine synthase [Alphaproteobacteria bacterium]
MIRLYIPVYALTLLLSAALLFSVQPMFSKMILPLLGGTPQVWNTAMLFFQLCLLGGYAYAHGTSRFLGMRAQAILHFALLVAFAFVLPFAIPEGWLPPVDKDPTLWQLSLMAMTVGGPFFVLAGSAPMLQRWFSLSGHPDSDNPYFLYGASNLGSMTSLLAYPVLIEPLLTLNGQAQGWAYGYFALAAMTVISAFLVWKSAGAKCTKSACVAEAAPAPAPAASEEAISWKRRGYWLILAFIPSSLMLGVTTFLTTDIASAPLLWILPLALYVGTFILVFARKPLFSQQQTTTGFEALLIILFIQILVFNGAPIHPLYLIALHLLLFFFVAMFCHTALAAAKPHASKLTEFYLIMSIGGALGGFFNAIIAPQIFILPFEYILVLSLAAFMRYQQQPEQSFGHLLGSIKRFIQSRSLDALFSLTILMMAAVFAAGIFAFGLNSKNVITGCAVIIAAGLFMLQRKRWPFAISVCVLLALFPPGFQWGQHGFIKLLHIDRNFFGVIRVVDTNEDERILLHGTTTHGAQALAEQYRLTPLSYYSPVSPINDVFAYLNEKPGDQEIGVIGLGIGVTACFKKPDRHFDFYEIDPDIVAVAQNPEYFTYLSDCGSPYDIILGDGRMTIQRKPDQHYDMIFGDAFSSDNIPIHIITKEAISIYLQKLKPGGVILVNISNNFMDLEPILSKTAEDLGIYAMAHVTNGGTLEGTNLKYYPAYFMVLTPSIEVVEALKKKGWSAGITVEGIKGWSDQYSNIISALGHEIAYGRFRAFVTKEKAEKEAKEEHERESGASSAP